jgi:hypothetical protein
VKKLFMRRNVTCATDKIVMEEYIYVKNYSRSSHLFEAFRHQRVKSKELITSPYLISPFWMTRIETSRLLKFSLNQNFQNLNF